MPQGTETSYRKGTPPAGKPRPAARRGGLIFAGLFLAVAGAIAATVLLANDMAHLRRMFEKLGIEWPLGEPKPQFPRVAKGNRLKSLPVHLPAPLVLPPNESQAGAFVREVRRAGPALCGAFSRNGIETSGWQRSEFDARTFECLSESTLLPTGTGAKAASFFFAVKGNEDGDVSSIRMKLVAPENPDGQRMHAHLMQAVGTLMAETSWGDLAEALDAIKQLKDYRATRFGLSFSFVRETTSPESYNLILIPTNRDPAIRRSRDFFAATSKPPGVIDLPESTRSLEGSGTGEAGVPAPAPAAAPPATSPEAAPSP